MDRQKLTVTIAGDLFSQIDSIIDGSKIRNRSHATEFLIRKGLGRSGVKTAVILAGGRGERLKPLTLELPKALIPLQGEPLIAHTLRLLADHGYTRVIVCLGYKGEMVREACNKYNFGLSLIFSQEKKPLGTAGALRSVADHIHGSFLLVNGDVISDIDLDDLYRQHRSANKLATMALANVNDPELFGAAKLQGNQIIDFVEKPAKGEQPTSLINAGFTLCEHGVLKLIKPGDRLLENSLYPTLARTTNLAAYPFAAQWFHIGTAAQYERALTNWHSPKN